MQQTKIRFPPLRSESYLTAMEELTLELQRAVTAVTTGALVEFEQSLIRQQISCARLAELGKRPCTAMELASTESFSADPSLAERLKAATSTFEAVTRHYSMLLKHFGETARLFAGMFRNYGDPAEAGFCLQRSQGAWSCEL